MTGGNLEIPCIMGKKCSFFGKFGVLCFLVTSVLRFVLVPYYRRSVIWSENFTDRTTAYFRGGDLHSGKEKNLELILKDKLA